MTVKKSDRDMLVRRDAEGREEFVAWGRLFDRYATAFRFRHDGVPFEQVYQYSHFAVIPRDRIEVTDDVADLGPGWRVRYEDSHGEVAEGTLHWHDGLTILHGVSLGYRVTRPLFRLLSAWRVLPETPSEVEALADEIERWEGLTGGWVMQDLADHLHAQGYRKTEA